MERLKLRTFDGIAVTGFLMLPALFSIGLSRLVEQNNSAGWMSLIIAFAVMTSLFLVTACLMKRYEGKSFFEITSIVTWKPIGIIYGIILGIYFCFFTGINIREGTEILKIYGLKLTPMYVVAGLLLVSSIIMNFFGGRAIVKSAGFFFIIVALGIILIMLLGLNRYDPDKLFPVFGKGLPEIAKNGLYMSSLFDSVIVLFLFAPAFYNSRKMVKSGLLSLTIAVLAYIFLYVCYIMMFSPAVGSKMMSGFIEMGKSSYYNHFFYRFESILLFFLIFSSVMQASIGLFIARESFAYACREKWSKTLTIICSIFILIVIFIPANVLELTQKFLPVIRHYSVFFMAGFPLLILMISSVKRVFKK